MGLSTTISVETSPGSGVYTDLTTSVLHASITVKLNTLDCAFLNVAASALQLTAGVKVTNPAWTGTIAARTTSDPVDLRNSQMITAITATNAQALPSDTAPFDLSDVPVAAASGDYLLEDGSGHYLIEDGTDWAPGALLLEQALSYGYSHLSVQTNVVTGGPNKTLGRCSVIQPGLRPGNTFHLTSLNQGYTAAAYQVSQVTTRWPALSGSPFFDIEFGDTPQTLAQWATLTAPAAATPVAAPVVVPAGPVIYGKSSTGYQLLAQGGGIVTICSASFSISVPTGHTLTVQLLGQIDCRALAWDNFIATPRRAVRGTISGGIFTGAWQETPAGTPTTAGARALYDLSSAPGIALAAGTYTVTVDVDTQEFNQMEVFSAYAEAVVTTV